MAKARMAVRVSIILRDCRNYYSGRPELCNRDPGSPVCVIWLQAGNEICRNCEANGVKNTVKQVFERKDKSRKRKNKGRKGRTDGRIRKT